MISISRNLPTNIPLGKRRKEKFQKPLPVYWLLLTISLKSSPPTCGFSAFIPPQSNKLATKFLLLFRLAA